MATVGSDAFTESSNTNLNAHTPNVGSGWTLEANQFTVVAVSDEVRHDSTNIERARKGDDIGSDDMDVSARVKLPNVANRRAGVCARMSTDNFTNQYEAYIQRLSGTQQDVLLFKNVGGVRTQLGSTVTISLNAATQALIKLAIRSGSQKVYTDTGAGYVERISTTEADSTLSGRQYAGIIMNGNSTTTTSLDDFLSETTTVLETINIGGTLTPAGALVRNAIQNLAGACTGAGALTKQLSRSMTGSVGSSGALVKTAVKVLAGAVASSATAFWTAILNFTASTTPAGALTNELATIIEQGGTIPSSGALTKTVSKLTSGSIGLVGALLTAVTKIVAGAVDAVGALLKDPFIRLSGSVGSSGTVTNEAAQAIDVAGTIPGTGALTVRVSRTLTGVVGSTGALVKQVVKICAGFIESQGALDLIPNRQLFLQGTIAIVGTVRWTLTRLMIGSLVTTGALLLSVVGVPVIGTITLINRALNAVGLQGRQLSSDGLTNRELS